MQVVEVNVYAFLTLVMSGQLHTSALYLRYALIEGWLGLPARLKRVAKEKFTAPAGERTTVVRPIASHW
jgi:hypothetical protein